MRDPASARLSPADRAMIEFAVKLTRRPGRMTESDVATLRRAGFADGAIHEIVQIAALFNYYNRLAEGLGIDLEPEFPPREPR
jgi:uncharacterized peroxidase-related enzyme